MTDSTQQEPGLGGYERTEDAVMGILMIGAPLLMIAGAFLHPPHDFRNGAGYFSASHDYSTLFYISHTLFFVAATFFVPSIAVLARLARRGQPRLAFWGGVLSLMGFVGYAALDGIDFVDWVAGKPGTGLDPASMNRLFEVGLATPGLLIPVLGVVALLPIGLLVLAVGLARAQIMPTVLAVMMPVGMIGLAASLTSPVLLVLFAVALLAGFGYVGVLLLRGRRTAAVPEPATLG